MMMMISMMAVMIDHAKILMVTVIDASIDFNDG